MNYIFGLLVFITLVLVGAFLTFQTKERRERFRQLITFDLLHNVKPKRYKKGFFVNIEVKAKKAGLSLSYMEICVICLLCSAIIFGLGMLLFSKPLAAFLVSFLGFYIPSKYMDHKIKVRAAVMLEQLETLLPSLATYIRAGYSLPQAVSSCIPKIDEPLATVFNTVKKDMDASVPVVKALENAAETVPLTEFSLVVLATKINSLIGGNLADIYETIANTIGERREIADHQRAYTSEARSNSTIIGMVAFSMLAIFRFISPDYFKPLLETTFGQIFFALCIGLMIVGWFTVRKISESKL